MRFRNTQPHPLSIRDLGLEVGPGGEFDYPGWDLSTHGVITGCEAIDPPKRGRKASGGDSGQNDQGGEAGTPDTPTTGGDAASKETTQP